MRTTLVELDTLDTLHAWRDAETPVRFVALGHQMNAQGYTSAYLRTMPAPSAVSTLAGEDVEIRLTDVTASWYRYANLMQYLGWDTLTGTVPTGYTNSGLTTGTFTNDTYSGTTPASGTAGFYVDVICPVPGATLSLVVNVTSAFSGTGTDTIYIDALDFSGSSLTNSGSDITTAGTYKVNLTLPASTYKVRCWPMRITSISGAGTFALKYPTLRVDKETATARY